MSTITTGAGHVLRATLLGGLLLLVTVASGCSDDGRARVDEARDNVGTLRPTDEESDPVTEDPAPETEQTEEATPEPSPPEATEDVEATEAAPVSGPEDTSDDDGPSVGLVLLIVLLVVAVLALIGALRATVRGRAQTRSDAHDALAGDLSEVVGRSRWLHDSGSVEVLLVTDDGQLARVWDDVRTRMVDVENRISALAATTRNETLGRDLYNLGRSVAHLRIAEEGYVTTRLRAGIEQSGLPRASTRTVEDRRRQLEAAIEPVSAALRSRA